MVMTVAASRSPHGERGLKYTILVKGGVVEQSLSSWRAWIEIPTSVGACTVLWCRSPHGERGLKYATRYAVPTSGSRSPHGERGLK